MNVLDSAKDYGEKELPLNVKTEIYWINEFIQQIDEKTQSWKNLHENTLVDFYLFVGIEWEEISVEQSRRYIDYLKRVSKFKGMKEKTLNQKVRIIIQFLTFLHKNNVINAELVNPFIEYIDFGVSAKKKEKLSKLPQHPKIINEFLEFLERNGYYGVERYKRKIVIFQRFVENEGNSIDVFLEENKEKFLFEQIHTFEKMISTRVSREEIFLETATSYLRTVQLLIKYLCSKGLINRKYTIPIHLRGRSNRSNEYVPKERIIELMDALYETSHHILRDLSIFLIIVDTGCRPIEVSNLLLQDVDKVEKTLSFECGKTKRRKVKVSNEVMDVIKDYLEIRSDYYPKQDNLFINCSGNPITSSYINMIFYEANLKAFGESQYPAKAFRHTYITNALEEYSFDRVAQAIGHADWKSTYYYFTRSKKRLLSNTLNKSPL